MEETAGRSSKCRLCGTSAPLLDSHLIPNGVYRRIQNVFSGSKKDLVKTDSIKGTSVLESKQLKEKLLCENCEKQFKKSEDYFYNLIDMEDKSWISMAARLTNKSLFSREFRPIDLNAADIDAQKLAHFVLSVIWRCNVSSHRELASYNNSLGAVFANEIEQFLLEQGPFPERCLVKLTSYDNEYAFALLTLPQTQRLKVGNNKFHSHMLHFLGITFEVFRGGREKMLPKDSRLPCYGRIVFQQKAFEESAIYRQLRTELRSTEKKGKLDKLYPK